MKKTMIGLALFALMSAAASAGMKVKSESAKGADLSGYTSYVWKAADPSTSGLMIAEGTRIAGKIEEVGDRALAKAGLEKKASDEAGLVIRYRGFSRRPRLGYYVVGRVELGGDGLQEGYLAH